MCFLFFIFNFLCFVVFFSYFLFLNVDLCFFIFKKMFHFSDVVDFSCFQFLTFSFSWFSCFLHSLICFLDFFLTSVFRSVAFSCYFFHFSFSIIPFSILSIVSLFHSSFVFPYFLFLNCHLMSSCFHFSSSFSSIFHCLLMFFL